MKITKVETPIVRIPMPDCFGAQKSGAATLTGGLYHFEKEWNEVHPTVAKRFLVRIDVDREALAKVGEIL